MDDICLHAASFEFSTPLLHYAVRKQRPPLVLPACHHVDFLGWAVEMEAADSADLQFLNYQMQKPHKCYLLKYLCIICQRVKLHTHVTTFE